MVINFIISLIPMLFLIYLKTRKSFQVLQQNLYNENNRYIKWLLSNFKKVFVEIDMYFPLILIGYFFKYETNIIIFEVLYLWFVFVYRENSKEEITKKPLVVTSRIKRLFTSVSILYLIVFALISVNFVKENLIGYYVIVSLLTYLNFYVVLVANYINKPVEMLIVLFYKTKAQLKLKKLKKLKVIGVTGSYGKTSCKNIINDILETKYNPYATKRSFNTINGMSISINNHLNQFHDFFIAEMGAFKKGEIAKIAKMVKPTYAVITTIGTAHLETFGTQENIVKAKFELVESLPIDGVAILNGDDKLQKNYKLKNKCEVIWIGINNKKADVVAKNIVLSHKGSSFVVNFKGDPNDYPFSTKLLGEGNIYNLLSAIALGHHLGLTMSQLRAGVKKTAPVEHRLQTRKNGSLTIIDDAYNSNPIGSKIALDVLEMMPGTKIVITPGMIELGAKQYEYNMRFGQHIAKVADHAILIGKEQTKPIFDGLMVKEYDITKIHVLDDVKEALNLVRELESGETYVLLENDLPDIFSEK